jgi:hypothetical protein
LKGYYCGGSLVNAVLRICTFVVFGLSVGCSKFGVTVGFDSATQTVNESAGAVSIDVSLSEKSQLAVRVPYTLSGTATGAGGADDDYLGEDGTLIIPIGETSGSIAFPLIAHSTDRADRTLIVTLGTPENGELTDLVQHTVTIQGPGSSGGGGGGGGGSTGPPVITYSGQSFNESGNNDGTIDAPIVATVANDIWTTDALVENTHYSLNGFTLPAGLSLSFTRLSDTQMQIALNGTAGSHGGFDSDFFDLSFTAAAFGSGLVATDGSEYATYFVIFSDSTIVLYASAAPTNGNLGNRAATSAACAADVPAGWGGKANYQAVISYGTGDEIADMAAVYSMPPDMIVSETNDLVAADMLDLADGNLVNNLEEAGIMSASTYWWSGSAPAAGGSGQLCTNWTSASAAVTGTVGTSNGTGQDWKSDSTPHSCDTNTNYILCVGFD